MSKQKFKVIIISDGTGETATFILKAVMSQFLGKEIEITRFKNISSTEEINNIFNQATIHHDLIIYTIVNRNLRNHISQFSKGKKIRSLDALGPALLMFSNYFEQEPSSQAGLLHAVDEQYFNRVEAMEFTINHDDGKNLKSLHLADIVLVGVSRTSKTPLAVFLSFRGYKVMNISLLPSQQLPDELFNIDQRKIFALTIDDSNLKKIRKNRNDLLTIPKENQRTEEYIKDENIKSEIDWAMSVFKNNIRWPVINVTDRALEDTAYEIIKLIEMRKSNFDKQTKK